MKSDQKTWGGVDDVDWFCCCMHYSKLIDASWSQMFLVGGLETNAEEFRQGERSAEIFPIQHWKLKRIEWSEEICLELELVEIHMEMNIESKYSSSKGGLPGPTLYNWNGKWPCSRTAQHNKMKILFGSTLICEQKGSAFWLSCGAW